jgi:uncharacterized membrane protein YbjE (DUF340 family)
MTAGMVTGYFIRTKVAMVKRINKTALAIIFLLLFFMGVAVGQNQLIMQNLGNIGFKGIVLTFFCVIGSLLTAWLVYVIWFKNHSNAR